MHLRICVPPLFRYGSGRQKKAENIGKRILRYDILLSGGKVMDWIKAIEEAVDYIENNLSEDITVAEIAKQIAVSPYYFQKGFSLLCGFSVSEYIRKRRLSVASVV